MTRRAVIVIGLLLLGAAGLSRPRRVVVAGISMEPTLSVGDRLLVVRTGSVKAGNLIALRDPTDSSRVIVKRVSAVRSGEVLVRGDNSGASIDSRSFGPIPLRAVLGRVVRRYAPAHRSGPVR